MNGVPLPKFLDPPLRCHVRWTVTQYDEEVRDTHRAEVFGYVGKKFSAVDTIIHPLPEQVW